MDKKIQDAASDQQPPFQEKDWNRMEALLDIHLPQEKKRRPFLLWLVFLLLVGIPVLLMLTTYKRPPELVAEKISSPTKASSGNPSATENSLIVPDVPGETEKTVNVPSGSGAGSFQEPLFTIQPGKLREQKSSRKEPGKEVSTPVFPERKSKEPSISLKIPAATGEATSAQEKPTINTQPVTVPSTDSVTNNTVTKTDTTVKDNLPPKEEKEEPVVKARTPKSNKQGKLQINFSAGPDLTMIGMNKTGQWKMQYGIGLSYALSKRWQIRTGFLASRKLYTADSSDYHPPKNFWNYYPNLQKIEANCLVFEIPLNVIYTFPSAKKHEWFVSAGVSSYLMKKENYEYYYKDPLGQPAYRSWDIENENNHFFSILQLSGGYQYRFSERFSLMAEPYFKLPVSGVGFGKVKLNNTGVLFTVGYRPLLRKRE
ncbi:MAG TPA: hypothetical protein VHN59_19225 [Chitinophagaceae bacterium]|nr:hypothetical protein [Chitinophagaceae bacterium]